MTAVLQNTALAFVEGLGLALSPCILPVLPFILAASAGRSALRPLLIIAGFIISFCTCALLSRQLLRLLPIPADSIQTGSYVLLLILGATMLVPAFDDFFARLTSRMAGRAQSFGQKRNKDSMTGVLLTGGLIGLIWTPCAGPLMAAALLQTVQAATNATAVATIAAFSMGAAIPMLLIAFFGQYLITHIRLLSRHAPAIRKVMGVIVICFALLGLGGVNIGIVAATSGSSEAVAADGGATSFLDHPYQAPALAGITQWLNSQPLDLASLKGKVVLIDFWTYSCINCIRTLPHIENWYEKYKDSGFVVIGVHTPEFAFEGDAENVKKAIASLGVTYPVAMDNNFATWNSYQNKYWPAHYLIDRDGRVVYTHFGEGNYATTENNIRHLLGIDGNVAADKPLSPAGAALTPETYLGQRAEREFTGPLQSLPLNHWTKTGNWTKTDEYIESSEAGDRLTLHFAAKKVFLVMESADGKARTAAITVNGRVAQDTGDVHDGAAEVNNARLYEISDFADGFAIGTVTIEAAQPGLRLYAFTFGS